MSAPSDDGLWQDVSEKTLVTSGERRIVPDRYRLLYLDIAALNDMLSGAASEDAANRAEVIISMPLPDERYARFSIAETAVMAPELAARFPDIKTYRGIGIDDPASSARISVTPQGFKGMILAPAGTVYIDPYQTGDNEHYISYFKRDYRAGNDQPWQCLVEDAQPEAAADDLNRLPFGTQLRTYRLALAATGEYTQFHGGTAGLALAAMATTMNRVNGIYVRDIATRMQLVANNNLLVYTDGATDPYSNGDAFTMLSENQNNIDSVIGTANYDIGHVFGLGSGGVAGLGVVCDTAQKAEGVTGRFQPVGDPFDIDYVAHEMGHQFRARHTFNGTIGSCSGGNRTGATAYEPGSGSTIMAYAGICGPDNLQANSDDYFHVASLLEISGFLNGAGGSCGVTAATGNTPPGVDAGPAANPAYTIPIDTPFELTGSASDANNDILTYSWEEFDLGPAGAPASPTGDAPLFRSFAPVTSTTRTFPKLADLLNNTSTIGELLPAYTRNLTFRLTVRDNRAGGGAINSDLINLDVAAGAGPFTVTAPDSAVSWTAGTSQTVTWSVANTNTAPVSCSNVDILLSGNGGNSFPTTILAATANDGNQTVAVPNIPTASARIKVACTNNVFFDISNTSFTIIADPDFIFEDQFESAGLKNPR